MIGAIKTVLTKLTGLFIVTQPKLNIEPLPGTSDGYGEVYRLTEPSGEHRDVYVLRQWEINEETGKRTAVTVPSSRATGYTNVVAVDYEHRQMRGNPTVILGKASRKKLSFEDHEALVEYFEEVARTHPTDFDRRVDRLYPKTPPKQKKAAAAKNAPEQKL